MTDTTLDPTPATNLLRIQEVAAETGLTPRAIRYYEELGILPSPKRTDGGTRRYPREYVFYVDVQGHATEPNVVRALREVERKASLYKNLGSYPTAAG